jgi:predicted DCC family thiol-disulfide oxidoreductase YuxK
LWAILKLTELNGREAKRQLFARLAIGLVNVETGMLVALMAWRASTGRPAGGCFSMQAEQSIVVDPKSPGGINSPHGLILFDGVCVLCSRGCRFVSKRDRRGYFRFVPIQLAEGHPLAEQLGINPDRPDSFAFVATGQAYVKSEAALRIARELPRWQWTWVFHFIPRVIRDAIYDWVARNRYHWFGRRDACILPNSDGSWPSWTAPRLRDDGALALTPQTANALSLKIPTADDLVILCRKGKAEEALQRLREIMGKLNDAQPPAQPHSGVVVGASR